MRGSPAHEWHSEILADCDRWCRLHICACAYRTLYGAHVCTCAVYLRYTNYAHVDATHGPMLYQTHSPHMYPRCTVRPLRVRMCTFGRVCGDRVRLCRGVFTFACAERVHSERVCVISYVCVCCVCECVNSSIIESSRRDDDDYYHFYYRVHTLAAPHLITPFLWLD